MKIIGFVCTHFFKRCFVKKKLKSEIKKNVFLLLRYTCVITLISMTFKCNYFITLKNAIFVSVTAGVFMSLQSDTF